MAQPPFYRKPGSAPIHPAEVNAYSVLARDKATTRQVVQQVPAPSAPSQPLTYTAKAPIILTGTMFSIPLASATGDGYLSAADWSTFNAKEPALGNPPVDGYLLSSLASGMRSWVAPGSGSGLFGASIVNPPALASFTWLNQGAATAQQNGAPISISLPNAVALNWRILYKSPIYATPYTVIAFIKPLQNELNSQATGLYFYDSGSGKLMAFECLSQTTGYRLRVERLTDVNTSASTLYTGNIASTFSSGFWIKIRNNGTTLYYDVSMDGANWRNLASENVGTFLTPDKVGFGGINANSGDIVDLSLISWNELNVATL